MGRLLATWTRETVSGSRVRLVISHPDAALYIQVPTLATTVAIQTTVNALCRNAIQDDVLRLIFVNLCHVLAAQIASFRSGATKDRNDGTRRAPLCYAKGPARISGPLPGQYLTSPLRVIAETRPDGRKLSDECRGGARRTILRCPNAMWK